jgi:TonB family protein
MPHPAPGKGLASASLILGYLGLLTAGGCGVGALVGFALAIAALVRSRDPAQDAGRDVAWAGIVTNGLSLLTIGPVMMLVAMLHSAGALPRIGGEEELPEPHASSRRDTLLIPDAPPPPPAPATPAPGPGAVVGGLEPDSQPEAPRRVFPVRVGGAIAEPKKVRHVSPSYPDIAKQARVQGVVILEATITPSGKVGDVKVLRGVPLLDEAALEAVKQWEYTPTLLNGVPVPVIMTITVNFRLQ